ncbi:hypothetical protein [Nocardia seriolae]|uniref:hypothetical protein n=1 Tax=Nocardia seriolae TaxID=37332 RepID=UPI0012BB8195|nr:hypothetical protein [Nocardia seriolae]MTJ65584.1 hypothetical protein [Nocardia seriolae]MTJ76048.1 hypothetical protein [Nocardia seriolae]MTJ90462.1 hypothetical protein [Nocardia seriolae]MTK34422.1 hypothetical protein [Nocardia seriolae]MTK43575.1 hypothetical protein [Nocardia seriolae]
MTVEMRSAGHDYRIDAQPVDRNTQTVRPVFGAVAEYERLAQVVAGPFGSSHDLQFVAGLVQAGDITAQEPDSGREQAHRHHPG